MAARNQTGRRYLRRARRTISKYTDCQESSTTYHAEKEQDDNDEAADTADHGTPEDTPSCSDTGILCLLLHH